MTSLRPDRRIVRPLALAVLVALGAASRTAQGAPPGDDSPPRLGGPTAEAVEFFETRIRPVLVERCYECHSAESKVLQGGLRLDTATTLRAGGDSGPVVEPHKPGESLLISAIRYQSYEMPPTEKLPDAVIADFEKWVEMGAPDPRVGDLPAVGHGDVTDLRKHWAFQPPLRATPPDVKQVTWPRTDIDRFVLARIEQAGINPSQQAEPRALLRRLYYDLTGLPPTAEELAEFAADPSDARYEQGVDRLLASPRFGERWARYWLDVARYSDTKGYVFEEDRNYKHAYLYRDWVIASFNADRPFDQFVIAQLAADQLDDKSCGPAIGFVTLGRRFLNSAPDIINDRIDVVTRGMLGLTVACARCHDHKFDPISADDYYAMYGVFANSQETPRDDAPPALADAAEPAGQVIFLRGNPGNRGPAVERHFLSCLTKDKKPPAFQRGSGRREMAEAIGSRDNPLTARVWANRIWGHLFGRALVITPSDFGTRGTPPTHPELLDWLATALMEDGWSTKRLIRSIVLSSAYRQASVERAECVAVDSENQLLWRANRRRLDLESLRDSLLVAAGRLDETQGGPSVALTTAPFSTRRSVYGFIERQNLPAFFRTFDFANPNTHTPERPQTVSPQQALFLMNSPFVIEQATHLAARTGNASDPRQRIAGLFRYALGRGPTDDELAESLAFIGLGDSAPAAHIVNQLAWQFGWGALDDATGKVAFQPLPHFTGSAWQGGGQLPDPTLGWVMLTNSGGHPGDAGHLAIRRWTAPSAGTLRVEGVLAHGAAEGDGVRARIVSSRHGVVGTWESHHGETAVSLPAVAVEQGDAIDFVVDGRAAIDFDSFNWTVTLQLSAATNEPVKVWDSTTGFHGPLTPPLLRWEQLAQVLLMSNEFVFVD